jgi:hypothetical protein
MLLSEHGRILPHSKVNVNRTNAIYLPTMLLKNSVSIPSP